MQPSVPALPCIFRLFLGAEAPSLTVDLQGAGPGFQLALVSMESIEGRLRAVLLERTADVREGRLRLEVPWATIPENVRAGAHLAWMGDRRNPGPSLYAVFAPADLPGDILTAEVEARRGWPSPPSDAATQLMVAGAWLTLGSVVWPISSMTPDHWSSQLPGLDAELALSAGSIVYPISSMTPDYYFVPVTSADGDRLALLSIVRSTSSALLERHPAMTVVRGGQAISSVPQRILHSDLATVFWMDATRLREERGEFLLFRGPQTEPAYAGMQASEIRGTPLELPMPAHGAHGPGERILRVDWRGTLPAATAAGSR